MRLISELWTDGEKSIGKMLSAAVVLIGGILLL